MVFRREGGKRMDFSKTMVMDRGESLDLAFNGLFEHQAERELKKHVIDQDPNRTWSEEDIKAAVSALDPETVQQIRERTLSERGELLRQLAAAQYENAKLKKETQTHSLTHLANRGQAMRVFESAKKEPGFVSGENNLVLVRLDLDGFKDINDTFGHNAGDDALKKVAEKLKLALDQLMPTDLPIHFSGDEFGLILTDVRPGKKPNGEPKSLAETVESIISKVISQIEEIDLPGNRKLTASAGFKVLSKDEANVNFETTDSQADVAAELSKGCKFVPGLEQGSDRIVNYDEAAEDFLERKGVSIEQYKESKLRGKFARTVKEQFPALGFPEGVPPEVLQATEALVNSILAAKEKPARVVGQADPAPDRGQPAQF